MKKNVLLLSLIVSGLFGLHSISAQTSVNFGCTGAPVNWTVPPCVTSINVTVAGAEGGGGLGGNGAVVTATIPVTPGQVIGMNVGCSGTSGSSSGGYGGGGTGFASTDGTASYASSGGGGASTITIGGVSYIIAAGGGGEGGGSGIVGGGAGGCATGATGTSTFGGGATGGTQTGGGIGGTPWAATPPGGSNGGFGFGGMGGFWETASGGGGGGGYYGGGGGGNDGCCTGANGGGGGGGGSSLVPAGAGCTQGSNNGPGYISVSYTLSTLTPIVNSPTVCAGTPATLTASGATTYAWSNGATGSTISVSPATTTSYTVTGTSGSCSGTAIATVTVTPLPPAPTAVNASRCGPGTVGLSVTGCSGTASWYTVPTGGTAVATGASFTTPSLAATTTYYVSCTVGGCTGPRVPVTATINPIPLSTYTQSPNQCLTGNSFSFTNTGSSGAGFSYSWNFGGGGATPATSTSNNVTGVSYTTAGTYTVTHIVTNTATGCSSSTTSSVTITPNPVVSVNSPTICAGQAASLTAAGATTYAWSTGAATNPISVSPGATTTYTVTGTTAGCPGTAVATVTVNPLPTVTVNSPTICNGAVASLTAGGAASYSWSAGAISTGVNTANASPSTTTTYTVTGTTAAGCSNTAVSTVFVNPLPVVNPESNVVVCAGAAVGANTFTSTPAGATFTWTNSNTAIGLAASGTTSTPGYTAANATGSAITSTITITPTLSGCVGTPITYTITVNPLPAVTVSSATICPGGTATLTAGGATTYAWSAGVTSTGVNTGTASPATTTSYTVTGTTSGCSATAVATVTVSPLPTVTVNSPTICNGAVASLTAGGAATYAWSAGATSTGVNTANASPSTTTTYTVTGTAAGGCINTAVATVTVNPLPLVNAEANIVVCPGAAVGANTFTSTPAGATFTWTNSNTAIGLAASGTTSTPGFTAANATGSAITSTITITPTLSGCVGTPITYTITVNPLPVVTVNSVTICPGGTATLTAGGATTYAWSAGVTSTGVNTGTASPATTTSYTVTGTTSGCSATAVATVTVASTLVISVNSPTICNGDVASLTASGGTTYTWSAGASVTGTATASASPTTTTSYTVTGTAAGCSNTAVATVTVNPLPVTTVNSPTICAGQTANLTAGGATTYTWSAGATSTGASTATASPATTTSYTVTGTTAGCSSTAISTVTVNPLPLVSVNSPTICAGQTAALTAAGASSYSWSAGAVSTGANTATASPGATTTYTVTGTSLGCSGTAVATVTVTPLPVITVNSPTICNGQTASLTASGGTSYTWSAGASSTGVNTAEAFPSSTTTYTVTGTSSGCSATAVATVTVNPIPTITVNSPTICQGAAASLTAGGAGTYTWSAGATSTGVNTASASPASTTTYTVTGTAAGCTATAVSTVTVNPLPVVSVNSPMVCPGQTATLTATGAASYTWSPGVTPTGVNTGTATPGATTSYTVTGTSSGCSSTALATVTIGGSITVTVNSPTICPGATAVLTASGGTTYAWSTGESTNPINVNPATTTSYTVTGTSAGCTGTAIATVTVNSLVVVSVNSPTICAGQTASLTASGAASYTWSAGASSTGVSTADATPSLTTTYTVTGTSAGGCTGTATATVTVTPLPTVTVSSPTICFGNSATLTAGGATTYLWSPGATSTGVTTATAAPASTTSYTVTGTASGCTNTAVSTVTVTPLPVVSVNSVAICAGQTAALTALGGTTYTWSAGATSTGVNTANASPMATTTYTVTGTASGCSNTAVSTVTVNPLPLVSVNSPTICNGNVANLTATGATSYVWSAGASATGTGTADALPSTTTSYTVTGTDAAGCSNTAIATVTVTPLPAVTVSSPTICVGATATMTASGATSYAWSPGATASGATTATASPASTTSYTVTGTSSGCSSTAIATVTVNPLPVVSVNSASICPGSTANLTALGATSYSWSAGAVSTGVNTASASPVVTTTYTVTGTLLGCVATATSTVSINAALTVDAGPNDTICFGQSTALSVTPNGAGYSYSWSPATGLSSTSIFNPSANPSTTTTYVVVVTDINGCTGNDNVTIYSDPQITPVLTPTNVTCNSACNGQASVAVSGGSNIYTYAWSSGASTAISSSLCPASYTVTVTDSWGCTASGSTAITEPTLLVASITSSTPVSCNGACNGTASASASGGTPGAGYTYSWNTLPVQTSATATALCAGNYTVTVSDANNCTSTATVNIIQPSALSASITAQTNASCFGTSTGSVTVAGSGGTPTYTYSINAGVSFQPSGTFSSLTAGSYTIIVQDGNGCTVSQPVVITQPTALSSSITAQTNVNCFGASTGEVTVAGAGASPAYSYSINAGASFQASGTFTALTAGSYTIIVQDANGCTINQSVTITQPSQVTVSATKTDATCGAANGAITATGANGSPGYTYSIGGAFQPTGTFNALSAGTYTVTVSDANGCTSTTTITVVDLSGITASITAQTNVSCNGASNGSVTVTASGSTPPYTYSFNGGAFGSSGTFSSLSQGTYTITAQDGNLCQVTVPVTITQPPALSGIISAQTNISCFGLSDGTVTVSPAGGTPSYTYSINGGTFGPSPTFIGLSLGAHTVTIKDANGCTFNIPVTITQPTALVSVPSSTNATCTAANGSASIAVSGGTITYSYLWAPSGATTSSITGVTAGNYTVTVTDANSCTQTTVVNVGQNPGATAVISSSSNVSCAGLTDGSATVSMGAGATPPFSYLWSNGQTTVTAINLGAASYNVTVTDGNGCISTANVVITEPTVITNTFSNVMARCFGSADGSSLSIPSGGTLPYTYLWTPGGQTTQTAINLTAGTYSVLITDANGCTHTASTTITQPTPMVLTETHTNANCGLSNGSATVSVAGGVGPYTYSWSTTPVQTTPTATSLASNTYVVTVIDTNLCVQTLSVTINDLAGPVATITSFSNVSCNGENDGSATATISGGTSPYTFAWSSGATLPSATNLVAGTYSLTATDVNGCVASTSITITEPAVLSSTFIATNPSCSGMCDGSVTTLTNGGTSPYSYLWTPGGMTTSNVSGLCAGSYILQVTDANGCTTTPNIILVDPPAVTASTSVTNVSCSGVCDGTATADALVGTGPFTYLWSDINTQTTQVATGLCTGNYTVTVTDANGCTATAPAAITSPASMSLAITSQGNVTCFGACDAYAGATVSGGTGPYSYMWMPGGTAGSNINNLCADTYTVTVTDANGCTATTTVTLTQPNALVATITNTDVTCFGACDASATAVYTGGTGPYTFLWTPGLQTTPTISAVCAGVHDLTVTDNNGCEAYASVVITEPTILDVTTTTVNSNCGVANGSACAAIIGGSPPFTYQWNDPALQTTSCATGLNAGIYTISVTDSHGCSATNVANVNDNTAPVVTIPLSSNVTCAGAANGSAQASVTGGIIPYTILWTPSAQTTLFASALSGGIYSVVVTDSVGCVGSASVTINEPSTLVSAITATSNVSCNLSCDGTATVLSGGGTTPYTYLWNDAATQTTTTATGLCAAAYTVTTTDANGCVSQSVATITEPAPIVITLSASTNVSCFAGSNGSLTVAAAGGTPGYTYTWTPAVGTGPVVSGLSAGTYTVTVTDANGCSSTAAYAITQPTALVLTPNSNPSTCGNSNGSAGVTVTGGVAGYTYSWSPTGLSSAIITNVMAGSYNVTVTDANGCMADTTSTVLDQPSPTIGSIPYTSAICAGTSTATATVMPLGGTPLYSYQWSGPGSQTTQTATALPAGSYTVTVTDNNGCTVQGVVVIPPTPAVGVIAEAVPDTICVGELAQVYGAAYGGNPGYTYTWSPSFGSSSGGPFTVTPVSTTSYTVFATDAFGCISEQEVVTVYVRSLVTVTATDVSMCEGSSVTISATATGGTGGPYTYNWNNGVSGSSQTVSPALGASPMDYIVTVDDGCSLNASDTATVTVNPQAVSFMTVSDTAGCEDFTVSFTALSNIGVSYQWDLGDGSTASGTPLTHTYVTPGSYDVSLTVTTAMGCVSTISTSSFVDVYPAPSAAFTSSPTTVFSYAPTVTFTDASLGASAWYWDFIHQSPYDYMFTDSLQNPVFTYPDTGLFNVQLVVYNNFGCTDTATEFVQVVPEYVLYAPTAFTPLNHDGVNDVFMPKGLGIDPDNFEMSVFDRWGNLIFKTTDLNKGWDGKANGGSKVAQIDTYIWKIITKDHKGDSHEYIGHVTIVK